MTVKTTWSSIIPLVFVFLLSSCKSQIELEPTETRTVTITASPTETTIPTSTQTYTPEPTDTPVPTKTSTSTPTFPPPTATETEAGFLLPMPSNDPVMEWEGIPVKPDAIAGDEDNGSYYYTVENTVEDVQLYYEQEMGKYGWSLFAVGQGNNDSLMLMFQKGAELVTISVFELDEITSYIFIVK